MAKARSKAAAKPKKARERKAKAKPPKPTIEQLSDQQRQALLFQHKRKIAPLIEQQKEAAAAVKKAFELAKEEGIPKKEILYALQLESDGGIDAAKSDLEQKGRVARWLGISKQLDFGFKETAAERHYEDGRRAALDDQPAKPPSHLSQKDAQIWLDGHAAGRTALNAQRVSSGFRTLGEAALPLVQKTEPMPGDIGPMLPDDHGKPAPIGTEEPTHVVQ